MLIVDQFVTTVFRGESRNFARPMLSYPADEVIGHANIEHLVIIIRQDVDPEVIVSSHTK